MGKLSRSKRDRPVTVKTEPKEAPWTPFERAVSNTTGDHRMFDGEHYFFIFKNSRYTVMRRVCDHPDPNAPTVVHLSIKRNDKQPVTNWRDMQKIKNELVGPECEGLQLFPAESRLVDTSNQYHLYVFADPDVRISMGYEERLVSETDGVAGARQAPFEPHVRPLDLVSETEMARRVEEFKQKAVSGV